MSRFTALAVKLSRAVHRALLVLVPRDVRTSYEREMIATFEIASADAAARGWTAICGLLLREIKDLALARRANRPAPLATWRSMAHGAGDESTSYTNEWMEGWPWRQAWRSLVRRPAFLTAAVVTLGLGAGATTAIFSLVDTVLIKPLPYPMADRLVTIYESSPSARERTSLVAPARLEDWHRHNRSFVALSGSYSENVTDTSGSEPERLEGRRVTPRFFAVFNVEPVVGRSFTDMEEQANGPKAVVISERLWSRRFQRDPAAVGRALVIGGISYPIVGVMPATFTSAATDVWLPSQLGPRLMQERAARFLSGIGRLRPGQTIEAGARELVAIQQGLAKEYPGTDTGWSVEIRSLKEARVGSARHALMLVFGAVALFWVIAVANIAGLTLVQVHRRARELAIRAALGASRARVIAPVIRESLIIAMIGGSIGAVLAVWLVRAMPAVLSATPRINELTLDWRPLTFVGATSLLAACAFSVVPAFAGTRKRLNDTIASGARGVAGGRHGLQKTLVVAQVALSVLLAGSAMLLVRSYYNLVHDDLGFDPSNVVTFHVAARWDEDRPRVGLLQERLVASLEQLPHVHAAGITNFLPATGATLRYQVRIEGVAGSNPDGSITVGARMIGGAYLRAVRAPLVAGSWCPPLRMDFKSPRMVMVNQRLADEHSAGQNLAGRSLRIGQGGAGFTIAGVVGNLAEDGHATRAAPYVYTCDSAGSWPDPEYVVRTSDARAFASDLRRIVRELDSTRAVFGVRPLQDVLDAALDQPRLDATMLGLFAAAAVTLAAVGLYSLFMLVVSERAREMAVRLAIGASPHELVRLVMTGAARLVVVGVLLGIALTAVATRVLRGTLPAVSAMDVSALAAASATLAIVSVIAVAGPALRAARTAPIEALRGD